MLWSSAALLKSGNAFVMFEGLFAGAVGSLLSSLGGAANSALSYGISKKMAKYNAELQLKNQQTLMGDQYGYNVRSLKESPLAVREGLEDAGFNPMLAISSATNAPTVGLGSAGMPSSSVDFGLGDIGAAFDRASNSASQRKLQAKEREKLDKLTDAELRKLEAESNAAIAHSGAAMYDAETKRMEATARVEKIKKEADSIDPQTELRNKRYGTSLFGRMIEDVSRKIYDTYEVHSALQDAKSKSSFRRFQERKDAIRRNRDLKSEGYLLRMRP